MNKKKSQLHILETIVVLAIFIIVVYLGFSFYTNLSVREIEDDQEENLQLKAINIAQKVSSFPEIRCSQENAVVDNCIDMLRLSSFLEVDGDYFDHFSFSKITVEEIYPHEQELELYNVPLEGHSQKITTNIPVSLFDPIKNEYNFGIIKTEVFSR
jgi:hypothetical protein